MKFTTALLFIALLLLIFVQQVNAQSENCSTEPSITENDTFGLSVAPTPMEDNFAMTGSGCIDFKATFYPAVCASDSSFDNVVCFIPTNSCEILLQTSSGGFGSSVNVFSEACQEPVSCIASAASQGPHYNSALLYPVSLIAGTQYCVVWERCGSVSHGLIINQINGTDCGALGALGQPTVTENSENPADGSVVQLGASGQLLQVEVADADSCTIHYGIDSSTPASVAGTITGNYCEATIPYGSDMTNDGKNYWYVEAENTAGITRYPPNIGALSFTVSLSSNKPVLVPVMLLLQ